MAGRFSAELILLQVVPPAPDGAADHEHTVEALRATAEEVAGPRGHARVMVDPDPARGIVRACDELEVDVCIVGNLGMSGRTSFLLGNVPNRVSHNARCTVIIVNTSHPSVTPGRTRPRPVPAMPHVAEEAGPQVGGRLIGRAARIGRVLARAGFQEVFAGTRTDDEDAVRARARRLRAAMEELGPTFAKMGQILSTRPDLLPHAFVEELSTLQDRVPPMSEQDVVKVMEEELGVPWEDVFESIDPEPMAAGTIAQVHRATLTDGERVVVKVQRPSARKDILQDLGLLELFAEKTAEREAFRQVVDLPTIVEHLSDSLRRELDFRQEAENLERMHGVLGPFSRLDVPRLYGELSTERLLVMEEIQGVPIREAPRGEARTEAARQLLESYYQQILSDGFFHADPHPGNMMWWHDRIYLLDLGMVGELMTRHRGVAVRELELGPILQEITEMSIRHGVRLPASLALTGKALAQMQLAVGELDPALDPLSVVGGFVMRGFMGRLRERLDPKWVFYEGQKLRTRLVRLVEAVERLAGARPGPRLQVQFKGTENLEQQIQRAGRRASLDPVGAGRGWSPRRRRALRSRRSTTTATTFMMAPSAARSSHVVTRLRRSVTGA